MQRDQLFDFATRYTAAWCSQDASRVAAFYSVDGSLSVNGGATATGRPAITEVAQSFMTAFPDMQVLLDEVRVQGERPEYHWTLIGTNTGPGGTGHRIRISVFESWEFGDDGLILSSLGQFDEAEYRRQLGQGVLPASPV